jgi:hypothetical protein
MKYLILTTLFVAHSAYGLEMDYVDRNQQQEYTPPEVQTVPQTYGYPDYYEWKRSQEQSQQHGAGGCVPDYSTGGCLDE